MHSEKEQCWGLGGLAAHVKPISEAQFERLLQPTRGWSRSM